MIESYWKAFLDLILQYSPYIKFGLVALLPVIASAILYLLDKKTAFGKMNYWVKQIIFGIVFGALAILGTEYGIPLNGAQANCRDAAVLSAGLLFGAPAGIIAGIIGGVERWIAVAWGVGTFTRLACSVSTIIAGFYAAALRKFMFENKKPIWTLSLAIGVVMEVFHLTMVFITNMATPEEAMAVVKACTLPLIIGNAVSVMLATIVISLLAKERIGFKHESVRISQTIQRWLLITVVVAFFFTTYFVYSMQNTISEKQTESTLTLALDDIKADISDASDENILELTRTVRKEIKGSDVDTIAKKYDIVEVSIINDKGIIEESTIKEFIGFDMNSGEQAKEFLCLLGDTDEYVQNYGPISYNKDIYRKYAGAKIDGGFVQIGYDAEHFQKDIDNQVVGVTKNRHVGSSGYVLILDKNLNIVSAPENIKQNSFPKDEITLKPQEGTVFKTTIKGEKCFCCYVMEEGYYVLAVLPQAEAQQMRNIVLYVNTFMEILVFAILFALIYFLIKNVVVNRIKKINASLAKITDGNLNEVVDVRSSEEFASLSDDINTTVDTLKRYIDEAAARIDNELEFAKEIQLSSLPRTFPAFPMRDDFDIYASMDTAKEVGGDFYDFYMNRNDKLNFLIADVSGKGIPAAMFMMRAKTELKSQTEANPLLSEVFTHSNNSLCEGNYADMFVTAWQGCIDLKTGLVKFVNAGHNLPLVKHENGKFEYLKSKAGFVLAGMEGINYKSQEIQLSPGDMIYLYTDGVTEATNKDNQLYGEDRLLETINSREFGSMKELCEYIKSDVDSFVGEADQFDDITMLAIKYIGTEPVPSIHFDDSQISDIPAVTEFIESELEKIDCPMKAMMQINVAIDEIYSNIVNHGYKFKRNKNKECPVTVSIFEKKEEGSVYVKFVDEGIPYNPLTKSDPDITLSADEREIGGLGIYMVKQTMDNVLYKYENGQNILTIVKKIKNSD